MSGQSRVLSDVLPSAVPEPATPEIGESEGGEATDRFLPITRGALMAHLTEAQRWPAHEAGDVRRVFRYLDYWRQQQYSARLMALQDAYEPFSPDSDVTVRREPTVEERAVLQQRVLRGMEALLQQANFDRLDLKDIAILAESSHYGLDLKLDLEAFEEAYVYYRGIGNKTHSKRSLAKLGKKIETEVPLYKRLCLVFKMKPFEARVLEVMAEKKCSRENAEKAVRRIRTMLPAGVKDGTIYMKLFRDIPQTDIEMVFPNTQVRFRFMDKVRLGATSAGGLGFGIFSAAGKIALLASNPIAAAGAALGVGGVAFRQGMSFVNQKQRYMVVMAQNLYFHSMADNRGVMIKIAGRAAEEDVKEEWLLYSVLANTEANIADLPLIDKAIEEHIRREFKLDVNFDVADALSRLIADGLVTQMPDGNLVTLAPKLAAAHLDTKWDRFLDDLPDPFDLQAS
jgi:Protein of unknown function (DUF3754)